MDRDETDSKHRQSVGLAAAFPAPARRQALGCFGMLAVLDLAVLALCPSFGGDCLYGLFSLIAGPVMLAGLLGVLLPRLALLSGSGWKARLAVVGVGGVAMLCLVAAGHVAAIRLLNADAYGGVLIRPRLLSVGLGLSAIYYAALAAIALGRRSLHEESPGPD